MAFGTGKGSRRNGLGLVDWGHHAQNTFCGVQTCSQDFALLTVHTLTDCLWWVAHLHQGLH